MARDPGSSTTPLADLVGRHQGLVAILVSALVVRISGLTEWWLNPDEGIYYSILTRESFSGFWNEVASNAHPPLYYLLLRVLGTFTWDFLWFRVFTLVCGLVAVWVVWALARALVGRGAGRAVAGLVAGLTVAFAPGAVELSQVIRPYMLQVGLLGGALLFLLRYMDGARPTSEAGARTPPDRGASTWNLGAYAALVVLALLTHYSSALALAAFGLVVLHDGVAHGMDRPAWRRLFAVHAVPGLLIAIVYVTHLRGLMSSALADDALDGWLRPYMIASPEDAWLAFLGFQHLLAHSWLRAATALLVLAGVVISAFGRHVVPGAAGAADDPDPRRPAVLVCAGFFVAGVAAALGMYPLGSTRHSAWLLVFVVPMLGWIVAYALSRTGRSARLGIGALVVLVLAGGPIGSALGSDRAPWAPTDRVLRESELRQMVDVLDPSATPELIVMSAQTFYLLLPFYPGERERATESADGSLFHFPLGGRRVLVSEAWDFTAGPDPDGRSHLASALEKAARAFPELDLANKDRAVLLIGGWRPPLVDQLTSASAEGEDPFLVSRRSVRGLNAFLLDLPAFRNAFGGAFGEATGGPPATRPTP